MKNMTLDELKEIEARLKHLSSAPWRAHIEGRDHFSGTSFIMTGPSEQRGNDLEVIGASEAELDFIANARQDIPRLLSEVYALRERLQNERS